MEKKPDRKPKAEDDILRRPLYLYDLPQEVLATLTLKSDADAREPSAGDTPKEAAAQSESADSLVGSQACSLCSLTFNAVGEQRSHLKSDLHHYNLKQKLRGAKPVSEAEFETLIGNLDESLSGSESSEYDEDEDEDDVVEGSKKDSTLVALLKKQATLAARQVGPSDDVEESGGSSLSGKKRGSGKPPLLWFGSSLLPENTYFGMYRAIFTPEELAKDNDEAVMEAVKSRQLAPISMPKPAKDESVAPAAYQGRHIFLCMIGGGHFAAMVVSLAPRLSKHGARPLNREAIVLAHKTMHRYTTRRKQGGSQSANDAAKGAAHSAGSALRRYNEQALTDDVRGLLRDWKGMLDTSDLLFIRATGTTNRRTLFGPYEGQVLQANDDRIRGFPFSTRRATQAELMRSFIELTRLKVREIIPETTTTTTTAAASSSQPPSQTTTTQMSKAKAAKPKLSEEEETAILHTSQVQSLIRRSKLPALLAYLQNNSLSGDFRFQPAEAHHHAPTPLHLAASQNAAPLIGGLLGARAAADPALRNADGRTPFELAGDRATRDAFRVARSELGEDRWRWDEAKVPAPMTRADAERREARERSEAEKKEADRRRAEEERLKKEDSSKTTAAATSKSRVEMKSRLRKTAQEVHEEETRGMTPEQRMRLERERRARAAERRMQANNG